MATKTTKEVKATTKAENKSTKSSHNYEAMAVYGGAAVMLLALAYNGAYQFLLAICRSDIKTTVFKIVAGVVVVLLVIVVAQKK